MKNSAQLGIVGIVGICITLAAIIIAFVADEQMRNFRNDISNAGKNMKSGLWKHSRHPNYFGELLTWWGIWLMAMDQNTSLWWTGIGALSITLMFVFISIPMMDRRSIENREGYAEHVRNTRALLPFPLKRKSQTFRTETLMRPRVFSR